MTKQSFPIPEGCKAVTVEQVGNQIITTFEPEFKRGDILVTKNNICFIFRPTETDKAYFYFMHDLDKDLRNSFSESQYCGLFSNCRHATPEEAQRLWDALAKEGKRWNPETMQVEEIKKERWRAKNGGIYYSVDMSSSRSVYYSEECSDKIDDRQYKNGNYFQTEEQAQRAVYRLKAELDKFWEDELI